jgi:hypothetical protein
MKNPVYEQNCGDNLDIRLVLRQPIEVMDESAILIGVKKNLNSPVVLTPARRSRANGALWLVSHLSILSLCLHLLCERAKPFQGPTRVQNPALAYGFWGSCGCNAN